MNQKIASDTAPAVRTSADMIGGESSGQNCDCNSASASSFRAEDCPRCGCSEAMAKLGAINHMTITNLINDCLENIFDRLPLRDLLNVSESSLKMRTSACSIFERKFGNSVVIIFTNPPSRYVREEMFQGITSIKTILKNFGSSITKLCLNYDFNFNHFDTSIENTVTSYCIESLTELYINNCHSKMMANFNETFSKIRIFKFMYGDLGTEISRFDKIFPEIEHLTLNTEFSLNCIQYHFRALTVLKVYSPTLTTENISIVIYTNPQLQVLKLEHSNNLRLNTSFLQFIGEKLLGLKVLGLSYPISSWTDLPNNNCEWVNVEIKSLKKIILSVGSADILQSVPLQLAHLLELKINILRNPSTKLIDFLSQAPRMETLTITIYEGNSYQIDSQYFFKTFPNLRHIFVYTPDFISNKHVVRKQPVSPIKNKYLTKNDHTPFLLASRVMTTKYLIQYSAYPNLHMTTTYKITPDFPVTMIGVTDSDGRCVPIAVAMTDDYISIFNTIKDTLLNFKPEVLMSDAKEVEIAGREVFGDLTWRTEPKKNNNLLNWSNSILRLMKGSTGSPVNMLREFMERCSREHEQKMMEH